MASFLLMLREGVEAALIVAILLAYLQKLGRVDEKRWVWLGTGSAVVASLVAGVAIFNTVGSFEGEAEAIAEGVIAVIAGVLLTWMILWMAKQARFIKGDLHARVDSAVAGGGSLAVGLVAFVAVAREGLESALFMLSTTIGTEAVLSQAVGGFAGLAAALVIGYVVYRGGSQLNLRVFFRVTGILLILFAAGLVAKAVHEFQEVGYLPVLVEHVWNIEWANPDNSTFWRFAKTLFGWDQDPSLIQLIVYVAYAVGVSRFFLRATKTPTKSQETAPEPQASLITDSES